MRNPTVLSRAAVFLGFTLWIGATSLPSNAQSTPNAALPMTPANWQLGIDVTAGGTPHNTSSFGSMPQATDGYDVDFDFFNPPPIGSDYVDAYFPHSSTELGWDNIGAPSAYFATDYRSAFLQGDTKTWNFEIVNQASGTSPTKPVTVSWPGITDVPNSIVLKLEDPNDLNKDNITEYDMRALSSFVFPTSGNASQKYDLSFVASRPPLGGDVNGDGQVTISDVLLTLEGIVGSQPLTPAQLHIADVDKNGTVDIRDVLIILKIAVGLLPPITL